MDTLGGGGGGGEGEEEGEEEEEEEETRIADGHCNTGTVVDFSVGEVRAEKSKAVVGGRSGEAAVGAAGGGRWVYWVRAGKVK